MKGDNVLHEAVKYKFKKNVKLALEIGMNINKRNIEGKTPLHLAVEKNNKRILKYLIKHNADLNKRDNLKNTPLHLAVYNNFTKIVKILVHFKAKVNLKNKQGLKCTEIDCNEEIKKILTKHLIKKFSKKHICKQKKNCFLNKINLNEDLKLKILSYLI